MCRYVILLLKFVIFSSFFVTAQKLEITPFAGVSYTGNSSKYQQQALPADFSHFHLPPGPTLGADVTFQIYSKKHTVSVQYLDIGYNYTYTNMYLYDMLFKESSHHMSSSLSASIPHFLFTYYLVNGRLDDGKKKRSLYLKYMAGPGISFNRSPNYYLGSGMNLDESGWIGIDTSGRKVDYIYSVIRTKRGGVGLFLSGRVGIELMNKKGLSWLSLYTYWHQGFTKMQQYDIEYEYGYFNFPEYQRPRQKVRLKSNGTSFGMVVGVPIRIIK